MIKQAMFVQIDRERYHVVPTKRLKLHETNISKKRINYRSCEQNISWKDIRLNQSENFRNLFEALQHILTIYTDLSCHKNLTFKTTKRYQNISLLPIVQCLNVLEGFTPHVITYKSDRPQWETIENNDICHYIETVIAGGNFDTSRWGLEYDGKSLEVIDKETEMGVFSWSQRFVKDYENGYFNLENRYIEYTCEHRNKPICVLRRKEECKAVHYLNDYVVLYEDQTFGTTLDALKTFKMDEVFENEFGIIIPNKQELFKDELITETKKSSSFIDLSLEEELELKFHQYFSNEKEIYNKFVTFDRSGKILSFGNLEKFVTHDISINRNTEDRDSKELEPILTNMCRDLSSSHINDIETGSKIFSLNVSVDTKKIFYNYTTGVSEIVSVHNKETGSTNYKSVNSKSYDKNLELNVNKDGRCEITYADEDRMTKKGELIVWKGCYSSTGKPCLVKLIIPHDAIIVQNGGTSQEFTKFRTNKAYVAAIYRIELQKCLNCDYSALYKNDRNNKFYCIGCTKILSKGENLSFMDLEKCAELHSCTSPFHSDFIYTYGDNITISPYPLENRNYCGNPGIYFFFEPELVFDYVFGGYAKSLQTLDQMQLENNSDTQFCKKAGPCVLL